MACHGAGAERLATSWSHLLWVTTEQGLTGCKMLSSSHDRSNPLGVSTFVATRFGAVIWGALWARYAFGASTFVACDIRASPWRLIVSARAELGGSQPARWQPSGAGYGSAVAASGLLVSWALALRLARARSLLDPHGRLLLGWVSH